jgi:hypothetical protein
VLHCGVELLAEPFGLPLLPLLWFLSLLEPPEDLLALANWLVEQLEV